MSNGFLRWYFRLLLVGIVIHELAHAAVVKLCGGEITSIGITSHVRHRGEYSQFQQLSISYAPVIVNSAAAIAVAAGAMWVPHSPIAATVTAQVGPSVLGTVLVVVLEAVLLLIAFSIAAAALPSYQDAKSPYQLFRHHLFNPTIWRLFTLPFVIPLLLVFLIPLCFTYVRSKSLSLRLITEVSFATLLLLQATGTVVIVELSSVSEAVGRSVEWIVISVESRR